MFDNVGGKIKGLAQISYWIGTFLSVIVGIAVLVIAGWISNKMDNFSLGILIGVLIAIIIIVTGIIMSWLMALGVYGFGEIVENSMIIAENTRVLSVVGPISKHLKKDNNGERIMKDHGVMDDSQPEEFCLSTEEIREYYPFLGQSDELKRENDQDESSFMDSRYAPYDSTINRLRVILAALVIVIIIGVIILIV